MGKPEDSRGTSKGTADGHPLSGRPWRWSLSAAAVLVAIYLAVLFLVTDSNALKAVDDISGLVISGLAALTLLVCAWRARGIPGRAAGAWLLLGLGYAAFSSGEALTALGGGYGQGGLSYAMDAFYLAFYPLFFLGALGLPKAPLTVTERLRVMGDITVVVLAAGILLWTLWVGPSLATGGKDFLMSFNAVAFPLGDLALLWAVLSLMIVREDRASAGVYRLLATSAILLILTDIALSLRLADMVAWAGRWLGFGWFTSHLFAVLAGIKHLGAPNSEIGNAEVPRLRARPSGGSFYLAYACLTGVFIILVASHWSAFNPVTALAVFALLLLVLLRQVAGVRENARLYRTLRQAHEDLESRVEERTVELAKANEDLLVEVGERKKAERRLQRQLKELSVLAAVAGMAGEAPDEETLLVRVTETIRDQLYPDNCGVLLLDPKAGVLRHDESYYRHSDDVKVEDVLVGRGIVGRAVRTGKPVTVPDVRCDPDYIPMDPNMRSEIAVPLKAGNRILGVLDAESGALGAFSKDDERVMCTLASQLATALERLRGAVAMRESEERFRILSDAAFEGIGISEDGRFIDANARLAEILGYEGKDIVGRNLREFLAPESARRVAESLHKRHGEILEYEAIKKDGTRIVIEKQGRDMPYLGRTVRVSAIRDITGRRRDEDHIRLQVRRLAALRDIDAAISSNLDLTVTMEMFLEHVVAQLGVDAADVLLLEEGGDALVVASARGLHAEALPAIYPLKTSFVGRAALEHEVLSVCDVTAAPPGDSWSPPLPPEVAVGGFRSYFAAPLISKGLAVGVLEVFGLSPLHPHSEWMNFLETLAGQAAIVVDNRRLFESIQRSNRDLKEAYDTTLEGWSRTLELRDQQTQGHTARVAELTLRLARAAGLPEEDLVNVRRGALLHDIGKVGIPDGILLKPGPLSEEEWAIMRRHTTYAHELLSPVAFLWPALDIPYCHHERWDGTGYPRGLKGEAIPLAARVFSVVDSWDALSHDRPYRQAWPGEQVRAFLLEKAGSHFEPRLVDLFLAMET